MSKDIGLYPSLYLFTALTFGAGRVITKSSKSLNPPLTYVPPDCFPSPLSRRRSSPYP
jgi:hypothetical protein